MTATTTTAPRSGNPAAPGRARPHGRPGRSRLSDTIELGARPQAVPAARRRTRRRLREWGLEELADDAESVVAELITNAVEATVRARLDSPVRLTLIAGPKAVLIAVWDAADTSPVPASAGLDAECGRGLIIVHALSARWDWKKAPRGGKVLRALIRGVPAPYFDGGAAASSAPRA
ncbi:MAG: ATP-binding protein [Trebonia sp.]